MTPILSEVDIVLQWMIISVVVVGFFLAFIRFLNWYRGVGRVDPLQPTEYEELHRFSLREEK